MKQYPYKLGDRVMTPDGRGTVVRREVNGIGRPGVLHDVFPADRPRMYESDILYYFPLDFEKANAEPVKPYEAYSHCNACGSDQLDTDVTDWIEHTPCEVEIKCRLCWFEDHWAYGHLESVSEIGRLNCKTYG